MRLGDLRIDHAVVCRETVLGGRYQRGETLLLINGLKSPYGYAVVLNGARQFVGTREDAESKIGEKFSVVACCYSDLAPTIL